jgi:hypothetical protein
MNKRHLAIAITAAALLTMLFVWLSGEAPLARVSRAEGAVQRDRRGAEETWYAANLGDELSMGDALRTGATSRARLSMSEGTVLDVAPSTVVRLLFDAPQRERFRVVSGSAEVQAGDSELIIQTASGPVKVAKGAKISVREEPGSTWVRVDMGRAQLGWDETEQALEAGQELRSDAHAVLTKAAAPDSAPGLPRARAADASEKLATPERAPSQEAHANAAAASTKQPAALVAAAASTLPAGQGVGARVRGNQVRVQNKGEKSAHGIAEGEHLLAVGTLVTVDGNSSVELSQANGGKLVTSGKAALVVGDGEKVATRVLNGKLEAKAGKVPMEIEVPGGRILLMVDPSGGAAGSVRVNKGDTQVAVQHGSMLLRGQQGEQQLSTGAQGLLSTRGQAKLDYEPPSLRDMTLAPGVSTTIHDVSPPTAVALDLSGLCGDELAVLEQQTPHGFEARAETRGQALVWFELGTTAYRVRCKLADGSAGKTTASGRVQVQRDAATRRVTKRAPELDLDLDGRKYTAVYQTLLPRVKVHLPTGLAKGDWSLRVEGKGSPKNLKLPAAGVVLESGDLLEGTYSLSLTGGTSPLVKKATTLVIQFDNSAPAAYLEGADLLRPAADGSVQLSGAALEDSQLSLEGKPVSLDRSARFEARAIIPGGARGVGLWIKNPRLGSHHYVRRIQGERAP